jgi:predicted Zn finger-like uncharacterized protein
MLIVCPNCATSYMIDAASLGPGGRMVRCARCQQTWFAGGEQEEATAFVDDVIAEAEAESPEPEPFLRAPPGERTPTPTIGDFGGIHVEQSFGAPQDHPLEQNIRGFASDPAFEAAPEPAPDITPAAAHRESFEPEAIPDAPSLVPHMEQSLADEARHGHESDDVETFAARRQRLKSRRKQANRSSRWTAMILALLILNLALIGGRAEVVRYLPQTASLFAAIGLPVNLQQLKFENVRITPSGADGNGLAVDGTIVSIADKPINVPILRFAVRNAAGQEIYTWTTMPQRRMLDPGDKLDFHSELASPPPDAKDVLVRFLTAEEATNMPPRPMKPGESRRSPQADQ